MVTKRFVPGSAEWAQLEQGPVMTVESVIDRIKNPKSDQEKLYLFDWSLPLYCPNLANELTIPKYFAGESSTSSVFITSVFFSKFKTLYMNVIDFRVAAY